MVLTRCGRETCSVNPEVSLRTLLANGNILHGEKLVESPHRVYSLAHLVHKLKLNLIDNIYK